ncbi:MAG: tagaturonate reductase [Bacteroidetes bacterium]|nr:tagaturonate reductase [Bacteroidota bacterium]
METDTSLPKLRRSLLREPEKFPAVRIGTTAAMPERVLQFGEGNFLRAFVDWQFNELINAGKFNGSIVVVQPLENGMVDKLTEQDGLYTVVQRGFDNGTLVERKDVVTAIRRCINPYRDYHDYIACASNPDLRYVISNTTESGIEYVPQPKPSDRCPSSYPAKLAILLFERFTKFSGDPAKGMIVIPCELIERNGDMLKEAVLRHGEDWGCGGAFRQWIEQNNTFCNTLVDRIVPGYPKDEAAALCASFGYQDDLIVACEVFHKWVIQGNAAAQKELPFETIGLNVVWTDDITPHRTLKVRILNGAHTTFTIPALFAGKSFVKECMDDTLVGGFIREAVFDEILPTLEFDPEERQRFASAVLERFRNPYIKHALISITLNSASKYKVRVLPSLLAYHAKHGTVPVRLSLGLAALLRFYRPSGTGPNGSVGTYQGKEYPIQDAEDVIAVFRAAWESAGQDHGAVTRRLLSSAELWGTDLTAVPGLTDVVAAHLHAIDTGTMTDALHRQTAGSWNQKLMMHQNF